MIKHIVYWTLKPNAEGKTAFENAQFLKKELEALMGRVPSLLQINVGCEFLPSSTEEVSLILVTEHADAAGLKAYAEHPEHVRVGKEVVLRTSSRKAIDFIF